ncbi:alpha/beta fold hydrolase [Streptomyces sp. NPDC012888]|uniref:alpha/beta fold hydrolase n=1 Tax=Streptomyces sp. NPDC012888 TaxID=3364855 RepID=UPI0036B3CD9A
MPISNTFTSYDGTRLAYHERGGGEPLVCVPGGAMRASEYLGDLGGLAAGRRLVLLDLRGTGDSEVPADESTYRVDHQVADLEALREHLGLERMDVLAHSAGGNLLQLYAAAHPHRLRKAVLVTPTSWAVDLPTTAGHRLGAARLRAGEEWYEKAYAAYRAVLDGDGGDAEWDLAMPFFYGRWDETARAHAAANDRQQNERAAEVYAGPGAFDPPATRAALRGVGAEVLVLAGELDGNPPPVLAGQLAELFPRGVLDVQPGAAHFPWLDDPAGFSGRVERFLAAAA